MSVSMVERKPKRNQLSVSKIISNTLNHMRRVMYEISEHFNQNPEKMKKLQLICAFNIITASN